MVYYIMDFGMFLLTMINSLKLHRMDNEDGGIIIILDNTCN